MESEEGTIVGQTEPEASTPEAEAKQPIYLVFDTETTGLFNFKLPADDPTQPHLASAAFILADEDGNELSRFKFFVLPDDW